MGCMDVTIAARIISGLCLALSAMVLMELPREIVSGEGTGQVAALMGLSMDEFDSRQRQTPHRDHPHHSHPHSPIESHSLPRTESERDILLGFLAFGILYGVSSALLAYASVVMSKWAALPWLFFQALSYTSQCARLVVQAAQLAHVSGYPREHAVLDHLPMNPHPYHNNQTDHGHGHDWREENAVEIGMAKVAWSIIQLGVSVSFWLVVLVAHRNWRLLNAKIRPRPAIGDDDFILTQRYRGYHVRTDSSYV